MTIENRFPKAKEVQLFYNNNGVTEQVKDFKGLVNEDKPEQMFNVVGINYKVAQHDDVMQVVEKALTDMGLQNEVIPHVVNMGARLRVNIRFPEIKLGIGNDYVKMVSYFDNSYDCSTGLRYELAAYQGEYLIFVGGNFSKFYHRHTKGMNIHEVENTIHKGVEVFQSKIKQELEILAETKVDPLVVSGWINKLIDTEEESIIPKKHLETIKNAFQEERATMDSLWNIYNMVCKTLGKQDLNMDRLPTLCRTFLGALKTEFIVSQRELVGMGTGLKTLI